jgi:hypothetical protein
MADKKSAAMKRCEGYMKAVRKGKKKSASKNVVAFCVMPGHYGAGGKKKPKGKKKGSKKM